MKCEHKPYCGMARIREDCNDFEDCETYKFYKRKLSEGDEFLEIGAVSFTDEGREKLLKRYGEEEIPLGIGTIHLTRESLDKLFQEDMEDF